MTDKNKQKEENLNEPEVGYGKTNLRIYHSFEEAETAEIEAIINEDPVERIRRTVQLILRVYGYTQEELGARPRSNKITIIRYGDTFY